MVAWRGVPSVSGKSMSCASWLSGLARSRLLILVASRLVGAPGGGVSPSPGHRGAGGRLWGGAEAGRGRGWGWGLFDGGEGRRAEAR